MGYPTSTNGGYNLVNFIAVEPIVNGRKGFSELELSALDDARGKRIWAVGETNLASDASTLVPGRLSQPSPGVEELEVTVRVEPFDNGARMRLAVSQRSDAPDEIRLAVHSDPGSVPIEYCILTATMGNLARTRLLWLKDEVVSSLKLYPHHKGNDFAPHHVYPLDRLARTAAGDVLVALTTDEEDPASVYPFPGRRAWHYGGCKVTQVPGGSRAGRLATICTSPSTHATLTGKRADPYPAVWPSRTSSCASVSTIANPSSSASPARLRRNWTFVVVRRA